jgi:hypothetical protein
VGREEGSLPHIRQHTRVKSIELDQARPGVVHDELAEFVPALIVAFSIAEGLSAQAAS